MGRKRKSYHKIILTALFLVLLNYAKSQELKYDDFVYDDSVKTVMLFKNNDPLTYPVIKLNSPDKLTLMFDDITGNARNLSVKFIHCDENWIPSNISVMEYMDGFETDYITDYDYSVNTLQYYVHYRYIFPNDNIRFRISGNYIVYVFDNDNNEILLSKRFSITEEQVGVNLKVKTPELPLYRKNYQELYVEIDLNGFDESTSPLNDIKLFILQNNRWHTAHKNIKPYLVENEKLIYKYTDDLLFKGNNEFRYFNTKTTRFLSQHVATIRYEKPLYHFYLYADPVKKYKQYLYEKDLNGKYKIDIQEGNDPELQADYVYVHFYLPYDYPFATGDLYIAGELTNWSYTEANKLKYDYEHKAYYGALLLKQGYYNYCYSFKDKETGKIDDSIIEGSYNDTENDYLAYIYFRPPGSRFTRLIAVAKTNSLK